MAVAMIYPEPNLGGARKKRLSFKKRNLLKSDKVSIMAGMQSMVTCLLDEIQSILKRQGKSVAALAQELGLSSYAGDSGYSQFYNWLVVRRYKPKGETVLRLAAWRDKQEKYVGGKPLRVKVTAVRPKKQPTKNILVTVSRVQPKPRRVRVLR